MAVDTTSLAGAEAAPTTPANGLSSDDESSRDMRSNESQTVSPAVASVSCAAVDSSPITRATATDPAPPASPDMSNAQKEHGDADDDHEGGQLDGFDPTVNPKLDTGHEEPFMQAEPPKTVIAATSWSTAHSSTTPERQSLDRVSTASAEIVQVHEPDTAAEKGVSTPDPEPGISCAEPCLQGSSAETVITAVPTAFSIPAANSHDLARSTSFTSPETTPVQTKDDTSNKAEPAVIPERDADHHQSLGDAPRVAGPSARRPKMVRAFSAVLGRRTAHVVKMPKKNGDRSMQNIRALQTLHARRSPSVDSAGPPVDKSAAGVHRGREAAPKTPFLSRSSTKSKSSQALHNPRALPAPSANVTSPPVDHSTVGSHPDLDTELKTPNLPQSSTKAPGGSRTPHDSHAPVVTQADVTTQSTKVSGASKTQQNDVALQATQPDGAIENAESWHRYPKIEIEGVRHEVGGLLEVSLGGKNPLFARQVQGNPSDRYNRLKVERHGFFGFPAPNMKKYNDELDRELEAGHPVHEGFDLDLVDQQIDSYAEGTKLVAETMQEHIAALKPVKELFLVNKEELKYLHYERQRMLTSQHTLKDRIGPQKRSRRLAEITAAETPLKKEQEAVELELKELVLEGRAKVARALRQDLRVPTVIDERRARAHQRTTLEEQDTELAIRGAMLGLRGTLKEQDPPTHTAILRYTQHVVNERLKAFDEADKSHKPRKPDAPAGQPSSAGVRSHVDTVVHKVPDWFTILDARGTVELYSATPLARFKELLQVMGNLSMVVREEQWADESRPERKTWDKHYHEPNDGWSNALRRARGGWWTCRSGPDAPPTERQCQLCHRRVPVPREERLATPVKEKYQRVLDEIDTAMAEASKRDRLITKHQLQQEREDITRYWQQRQWLRSGGGVDIDEVMHCMDVNGLNHRPPFGESQSRQDQNVAFQSQGAQDHEVPCEQATDKTPAFYSLPLRSSQMLGAAPILQEVLGDRQARSGNPSSRAAGMPRSSRRVDSPLLLELLHGRSLRVKKVPKGTARQDTASRDTAAEDMAAEDKAPEETASEITAPGETALEDTASQDAVSCGLDSPATAPRSRQRQDSSRVSGLLTGIQVPTGTPPKVSLVQSLRRHSSSASELLHGMQTNASVSPDNAPSRSLYRHNSSQVHDVLHGRHDEQLAEHSPTQPGPRRLRSSLSRPGARNKHKRVSWQL